MWTTWCTLDEKFYSGGRSRHALKHVQQKTSRRRQKVNPQDPGR